MVLETESSEETTSESEPPLFSTSPAQFYGKRNFPGLLALGQDYLFIALTVHAALLCDTYFGDFLALWLIGYFQFGTGEALAHEAAHYNLFRTKWLHTLFEPLIAHVHLKNLDSYRVEHKTHHVELMKDKDTTYQQYFTYGFMDENANLFWLWFIRPIFEPWIVHQGTEFGAFLDLLKTKDPEQIINWYFLSTWFVVIASCVYMDCMWLLIKFWFIPQLWTTAAFQYWSEVEEHYNTRSGARSNFSWIGNFFHHNEGYHWVHHRYPQIPFFRLAEAHAALAPPDADVSYGFLDTYRQLCQKLKQEDLWPTHPSYLPGPLNHIPSQHPKPPSAMKRGGVAVASVPGGGGSSLYGEVFDDELLQSFADYQYSAAPYVWIDRKLSPFWKWCHTALVPTYVHPNMVTLTGFALVLCCFIASIPYWESQTSSAEAKSETPAWLLITTSLCMFLYQTLDCIDGLQARALGLSSPLGQLFDHGLDAIVMSWGLFFAVLALNLSEWPVLSAAVFLGGYLSFFVAYGWADRHTGSVSKDCMYVGLIGVTSSEFTIMAILLIRALFPFVLDLTVLSVFEAPVRVAHLIACAAVTCDAVAVATALVHVVNFDPSKAIKDAELEQAVIYSKWRELATPLIFASSFALYVALGVWHRHSLLVFLSAGSVFAHLYQNLTLLDMADKPCKYYYSLCVPFAAGSLLVLAMQAGLLNATFLSESGLMHTVAATSVIWMCLWVYKLFTSLAIRLRLAILFVPKGWKPALTDQARGKFVSVVPAAIRVGFQSKHPTQRALFATTDFAKGTIIARNTCVILPKQGEKGFEETNVFVRGHDGMLYDFKTEDASVATAAGDRYCPSFDSMMNHSCEPNTSSRVLGIRPTPGSEIGKKLKLDKPLEMVYEIVADRDILSGDELTCDYDLFEWDCPDHAEITACDCGTKQCRKTVIGFKHLQSADQERLLPFVTQWVKEAMLKEKELQQQSPEKEEGKAAA